MLVFQNKEQVLRFMNQGTIRMSSQDNNFFKTIYGLIYQKKQITSNQDALFNKLLVKYKAQLKRRGHISSQLCDLPWSTVATVPTEDLFAKPNLTIEENDLLKLRVPYKSKFLKTWQSFLHNPFVWDSGSRTFNAPFSTLALKCAIHCVEKHFQELTISPDILTVLNQMPKYNAQFWTPTLTKINGNYFIAASNSIIDELISTIPVTEDPLYYFQLSKYGIQTDPALIGTDSFAKFAANFYNECQYSELDTICSWLRKLGNLLIVINKEPQGDRQEVKNILKKSLIHHHIKYISVKNMDDTVVQDKVLIDFWGLNKVNQSGFVKHIVIRA